MPCVLLLGVLDMVTLVPTRWKKLEAQMEQGWFDKNGSNFPMEVHVCSDELPGLGGEGAMGVRSCLSFSRANLLPGCLCRAEDFCGFERKRTTLLLCLESRVSKKKSGGRAEVDQACGAGTPSAPLAYSPMKLDSGSIMPQGAI